MNFTYQSYTLVNSDISEVTVQPSSRLLHETKPGDKIKFMIFNLRYEVFLDLSNFYIWSFFESQR